MKLGPEAAGYKECIIAARFTIENQSSPFVSVTPSNYSLKLLEMHFNKSFGDDVLVSPLFPRGMR